MNKWEWVKFEREHILPLLDQKINANIRESYRAQIAEQLESVPDSFTGILDGKVMICGGALKYWNGRAFIWTVFNEESKGCFLIVFRQIQNLFRDLLTRYHRLELAIPREFEIGRRRAKLLGFQLECECARKFLDDGTDCALYSLIREGV